MPLWYSDPMVPIALHGRLRRSPLTSWIFDVKDRVDHWRGGTNKSPTASLSPLGKRLAIVQLLRTHNLHIVVESGTFLGDTCRFLSRRGYAVTTIELDPQLAAFARLRFAGNKNVRVVEGDSGELLAEIATALDKPALYYLDGHYSGPGTAKAVLETPIMHEIKAVLAHAAPKSIVVIDDARCFGHDKDFPTMAELSDFLRTYGISNIRNENDTIHFSIGAPV